MSIKNSEFINTNVCMERIDVKVIFVRILFKTEAFRKTLEKQLTHSYQVLHTIFLFFKL